MSSAACWRSPASRVPRKHRGDDGGVRQRRRVHGARSSPAWWDRFGTAEVGTADLFEIALACDPPLPLGRRQHDQDADRQALRRMRDRVFAIRISARCGTDVPRRSAGDLASRVRVYRTAHSSGNCEHRRNVGERVSGNRFGDAWNVVHVGNVESQNVPAHNPLKPMVLGSVGASGTFFNTYARAHAHAHMKEETGKTSPRSPRSPTMKNQRLATGNVR